MMEKCFFFIKLTCELFSKNFTETISNIPNFWGSDIKQLFFCSTLSEFENLLLRERILINITTCQNETSS
jgi:hypothetical protein